MTCTLDTRCECRHVVHTLGSTPVWNPTHQCANKLHTNVANYYCTLLWSDVHANVHHYTTLLWSIHASRITSMHSSQSWQWVTLYDSWPTWSVTHDSRLLTRHCHSVTFAYLRLGLSMRFRLHTLPPPPPRCTKIRSHQLILLRNHQNARERRSRAFWRFFNNRNCIRTRSLWK